VAETMESESRGNESERQRRIRRVSDEQFLKRLEALNSKVKSGQATPEEKTERKAMEKEKNKRLKEVEKELDR
jgi:hypothetical protein